MKRSFVTASLIGILSAASASAQPASAAQQPPAPKPAPPAPAQPPAPTAPAPAAATVAVPFPAGAKIAVINPQRIFQESAEGKAALTRVNALIQKKQVEGAERQKQLQANQQKLQTSGGVMNEQARAQLEKEIEKQQVEGQRFQQDAQAEINELQQEVQGEFIRKVTPIIEQVAKERGLQLVFDATQAGFAFVDPGLDLTAEVIKKMDGGKAASTPKQ